MVLAAWLVVLVSFFAPVRSAALVEYNATFAKSVTYLAAAAHCDASAIAAWSCVPCGSAPTVSKAIVVDATLRGGPLQAYVAKMANGGVVVSYRGTLGNSLLDWLLDFEFRYENVSYAGCEGCELHRGFLESYEALQPGVAAALSVLGAADSPFVWVTGHSLGAAMAEVATFELIAQGFPVSTAYTFGTPRVGNPAWASAYAAVMNQKGVANFRVIHDKDAVPHLPPKWLPGNFSDPAANGTEGFRHPPTEVWYNAASSDFTICSSTDGEDPKCSDSIVLPDGFKEHMDYINTSMHC